MLQYLRSQRYAILGLCFIFCFFPQVFAAEVTLGWDPSASPDVVGYRVYYGNSSGSYDSFQTVTGQTTYTFSDLSDGVYYFAVTAFDSYDNESGYSNEVSAVVAMSQATCDINDDSSVNAIDLQALVNFILQASPFQTEFDLNEDGVINVLDLQVLSNVVLGLRSCQ